MPPRVRLVLDEMLSCSKSLLNCKISVLKSSLPDDGGGIGGQGSVIEVWGRCP